MTVTAFAHGVTDLFDSPFFSGSAGSSLVPGVYPVALNGRPYMIDDNPETYYVRWNTETIPQLRQQADQSNAPAEASLNPQGLWRRAQDSWHHGAGQVYRDRDSQVDDKYRFRSSKGIDPWTRYQIAPLPGTTQKKASANTNLYCVVAGTRIYLADGAVLRYSTDLALGSSVTGYTGASITSITSDGYTVYFTDGVNIWTTNTGTAAATSAAVTAATLLRYVKGRLMVAVGNTLTNVPTLGAAATMSFAHPSGQFTWVDCAEGNANIYAAGYVGDKSTIYRTQIKSDGTALDIPVAAGVLPDGEIVRAIQGYLGFMFIGTDKGVRFAEIDGQGNLTIGPLISTTSAVQAFEPQDRFMWFGWTNYDSSSTGLGRIDLTQFVATDQPAYASDLMVTGQGAVTSAATFTNLRVLTVSGLGLYAQTTALVTTATIDMGMIGYGLPDPKTAVYLDVQTNALDGSYAAWLAVDGGSFVQVGSEATAADTGDSFPTNQVVGERFEVRLVLTSGTTGPQVTRWTLKAVPSTNDGPAEIFHIPVLLANPLKIRGTDYACDALFELAEISSLRQSSEIVALQLFDDSYTGRVTDFRWFPYGLADDINGNWTVKGTCLIDFQRIT